LRRRKSSCACVFHALGDDLEPHAVREVDDGERRGGVVRVGDVSRMNARSIFSVSSGKALQVGEARIAGAEVVDRQPHAEALQLAQHLGCFLGVAHEQRLR
jgi:hypothetical protein